MSKMSKMSDTKIIATGSAIAAAVIIVTIVVMNEVLTK
jgi:hypothetical protein